MTSMTFESIHHSPRRAAARRHAPSPAIPVATVATALTRRTGGVVGVRNKRALFALLVLAVGLHAVVIMAVNQPVAFEQVPVVPKLAPVSIDIAPPPPPPVVKPKPLPQVAKPVARPVAAPPRVAPSVPIVRQAPIDTAPSADTVRVAQAAPSAPVSVPVSAPAPVETVTEPRGYAGYLSNPAPVYPAQAQDRGLEGQVILKVQVLASGRAGTVSVAKSSGHRILDDAAIKAVSAWAFDPAKRGQTAIDGWVKVPLNFKLS